MPLSRTKRIRNRMALIVDTLEKYGPSRTIELMQRLGLGHTQVSYALRLLVKEKLICYRCYAMKKSMACIYHLCHDRRLHKAECAGLRALVSLDARGNSIALYAARVAQYLNMLPVSNGDLRILTSIALEFIEAELGEYVVLSEPGLVVVAKDAIARARELLATRCPSRRSA